MALKTDACSLAVAVMLVQLLSPACDQDCLLSARASQSKGAKEADITAARTIFDEYKKRDLAGDASLVDLYATDARIESDIERKDTPTQKEHYDRAKYCAQITKTFADPALAKLSASTVYEAPNISRELLDKDMIKVEFLASHGDTAMKVHWLLRKEQDGKWLIAREHTVTYRKSLGLTVKGQ